MIALVDHDNVPAPPLRGPVYLVRRLLDAIGAQAPQNDTALHCRLYGGWFEGRHMSKRAQGLSVAIDAEFPLVLTSPSPAARPLRVTVELARSLAGDSVDLKHTYRPRSAPPGLRCVSAPFPDCLRPSRCPVAGIDPFLNHAACPTAGCGVVPDNLLKRAEQKLVDTMLVADLIRLAQTTNERLIVVSSDDDLWPGIRTALLGGARVVHVQTAARTPPYDMLTTPTYARVTGRW